MDRKACIKNDARGFLCSLHDDKPVYGAKSNALVFSEENAQLLTVDLKTFQPHEPHRVIFLTDRNIHSRTTGIK